MKSSLQRPEACSFRGRSWWETQSKAFWKSIMMTPTDFFWFRANLHFSGMWSNNNSVDLPFLKTHCELLNRLLCSGKSPFVCRPDFLKACSVDLAGIWDDSYHNPTDCLFCGYVLLELFSTVEEIFSQQSSSLQWRKSYQWRHPLLGEALSLLSYLAYRPYPFEVTNRTVRYKFPINK